MLNLKLEATARVADEGLAIAFRMVSSEPQAYYLTDRALAPDGKKSRIRTDILAPTLEEPDLLILASRLLPLSPEMAWATPPVVYATKLAPNTSHENKLFSRLPVRLKETNVPPGLRITRLRFVLGVIPAGPELTADPLEVGGTEIFVLSAAAVQLQRLEFVELRLAAPGVECFRLDSHDDGRAR